MLKQVMKYNCWLYLKAAKFLSNDPYGMLNITSGTKLPVFRFKHTQKKPYEDYSFENYSKCCYRKANKYKGADYIQEH